MSDRLQTLRLFIEVARLGSFSRGARAMRMSQPSASRLIARLEEALGATLFLRSARGLALTEQGEAYLERIDPILRSLEAADEYLRHGGDLRGRLRVSASTVVAAQTIVPNLRSFGDRHPGLTIELTADDRRHDLLREGIDVAIRFGTLPDSGLVVRLIGRWPVVIAAAPGYFDDADEPDHPDALRTSSFLIAGPLAGRELVFRRGGETLKIDPKGRITIDNALVAVEAVKAGLGLCVASLQTFAGHFETGDLVRVLPDWSLGDIAAHAVYPGGRGGKPAARAFVEHLIGSMRPSPE